MCGCVLNHAVFCNVVLQRWMVLTQHLPGPPNLEGSADPSRRCGQLLRETRRGTSVFAVLPVRPQTPQRSPECLFSTLPPTKAKLFSSCQGLLGRHRQGRKPPGAQACGAWECGGCPLPDEQGAVFTPSFLPPGPSRRPAASSCGPAKSQLVLPYPEQ